MSYEYDDSSLSTIIDNCSGGAGVGNQLFNYWLEHDCPAAYAEAINTNGALLQYNPAAQSDVQGNIVNLFNAYFATNTLTDEVTSPTYSNFQQVLLNLCIDPTLPGICAEFLGEYCKDFSREEVTNSPTLINFCGCYVEPDQDYMQYTLASQECSLGLTGCTSGCTLEDPGCTGQPACDPLCHRALTSQKANHDNGTIITCPQTICVIDQVTINVTSSDIPGGINFNTICSGCGGAEGGNGCLCVISGVNISSTMSDIGVGTNFNQFCGPNSVCIVEDNEGNIISQGGCDQVDPDNIPIPTFPVRPNIAVIIILIIVIVIIFAMALAIRSSSTTPVPET